VNVQAIGQDSHDLSFPGCREESPLFGQRHLVEFCGRGIVGQLNPNGLSHAV